MQGYNCIAVIHQNKADWLKRSSDKEVFLI